MADLIYILVALAFFALCVGYVSFADRIIGRGEVEPSAHLDDTEVEA
jgi:hypothetical protein